MHKEHEPIAGTRKDDLLHLWQLREEGEGRIDRRHGSSQQVEETPAVVVLALVVPVEETLQGPGDLPEAVGDEAEPSFGDALESGEGLDGEAREDLQEEVVGEAGHRAPLGAALAAGRRGGGRNENSHPTLQNQKYLLFVKS